MSVTIPTKDLGDVKDAYRKEVGCRRTLEDGNEYYIKRDIKVNG